MTTQYQKVIIGSETSNLSISLERRTVFCWFILLLTALCIGLISLCSGELSYSPLQVLSALFGEAPRNMTTVVVNWRLPRVLYGLLFGAALGVSGALFQSMVRNPLGSPDVIGFGSGAYTGALVVIILFQGSFTAIAFGSIGGGLFAAALVYLLAYKDGIEGFRLIIVGIGISTMLTAFNTWLLITASVESSLTAAIWGAGSLNGLTWAKGLPSSLIILISLTTTCLLSRPMSIMEMGDDTAKMLGINTEADRVTAMLTGVVLIASVTSVTGPVAFIALAAPQLAQRLVGIHSLQLVSSALMGAGLLLFSDYLAVNLFAPNQLPVGVITVSIGGLYLVWLLIRETGGKTS